MMFDENSHSHKRCGENAVIQSARFIPSVFVSASGIEQLNPSSPAKPIVGTQLPLGRAPKLSTYGLRDGRGNEELKKKEP
jgi:hypothetical protein